MEHGLADDDSPQSREGTLLHAYDADPKLERAVLKPNQQDLLRIAADLDTFIFERVAAQFCVNPDAPFKEWREQELIALEGGPNETPGHCDRMRYYPELKLLVIRDAKFGYKEVTPAAANYQLRTYAIAGAAVTDAEQVVVAITQPRLPFAERVTMATYSIEDIEASKVELAAIREASRDPNAPLHASEEACRYCKAKTKCPEFAKQLVPLDQGKEIVSTLDRLAPQQRDALIRACKFADFIKDPVMDHERKVIAAGGESLYELGKATKTRDVTDVRRAVSLLSLRGDLTRDEALDACSMHFQPLEEKLRLKTGCTWKVAKETIDQTLNAVIERGAKRAPLTRKKEVALLK